jgi:hypothetical protein
MEFRNELAYGEYWHPYEWTTKNDLGGIESGINIHIGDALVSNLEIQLTGEVEYSRYLKEDIEAIDKSRRP